MATETIVYMPIDGTEYAFRLDVDPPRRASWSCPPEPMSCYIIDVSPPLPRQLMHEEFLDLCDAAKNNIVEMESCR